MLPLYDPHIRMLLLQHVAMRLTHSPGWEVHAAGLKLDQVAILQEMSAVDLGALAAMRHLTIGVEVDGPSLDADLRAALLSRDARWMEAYFLRHGASWRMMRTLFKVHRRLTHARRRESGVARQSGRITMPAPALRERIYQTWCGIDEPMQRMRYYRLHQRYPQWPIEALELIVRQYEVDR